MSVESIVRAIITFILGVYKVLSHRSPLRSFLMAHNNVYDHYLLVETSAFKYAIKCNGWARVELFILTMMNLLVFLLLWMMISIASVFLMGVILVFIMNSIFILEKRMNISFTSPMESDVGKILNGSAWLFFLSELSQVMLLLLCVHGFSSSYEQSLYYLGAGLITFSAMFLHGFVFLNILKTATAFLWGIRVSTDPNFAKSLPHLLVTTKNGSTFFGQLCDPFDDKALILRKAKLVVHNDQFENIEDVISKIAPPYKRANHVAILWDEIEALQIIEEGLYVIIPRTVVSESFKTLKLKPKFKLERTKS